MLKRSDKFESWKNLIRKLGSILQFLHTDFNATSEENREIKEKKY